MNLHDIRALIREKNFATLDDFKTFWILCEGRHPRKPCPKCGRFLNWAGLKAHYQYKHPEEYREFGRRKGWSWIHCDGSPSGECYYRLEEMPTCRECDFWVPYMEVKEKE